MENTEEIYTEFARVYDELMDNTPYDMWCDRLAERGEERQGRGRAGQPAAGQRDALPRV